jgi:hypothetical protein
VIGAGTIALGWRIRRMTKGSKEKLLKKDN